MRSISLQQVREIVRGKPLPGPLRNDAEVKSVSTDTRSIRPGALFVAIRGDKHDGHNFLPAAGAAGAVAALVETEPAIKFPDLPLIRVNDARRALGDLARFCRQQLRGQVIAVGGSNGKTGTKNLIDAILSPKLRGSISPKSFNNDIGVPLAVFPADENQDYLVLELGTNHPGEVRNLTNIALPDIAVITNCSAEHLEGLVNIDGVRQEEASIIEGLNPRGLLIVNGDDPELLRAVGGYPGKRLTFGLGRKNDLFAADIACDLDGVHFRLNGRRDVFVPLLGRHIAINSLAAIAVGRRLGLPEDVLIKNLSRSAVDMRLQLQSIRGIHLLNDAYNANPASMRAALETLCALPSSGRRIAVIGDMRELGVASDECHREIGQFIATCPLDLVVCVGEQAALSAHEAKLAGFPADRLWHFPDTATAAGFVPGFVQLNDTVLLKASRYMKLEIIASAISAEPLKAAS